MHQELENYFCQLQLTTYLSIFHVNIFSRSDRIGVGCQLNPLSILAIWIILLIISLQPRGGRGAEAPNVNDESSFPSLG